MNQLWNRALADGRLHGLVHDGWWLHVGTPDAIALAQDKLRQLGQP
jgi:MurNAc alpha-1-phosphate uridylyltransferase